MHRKQLPTGSRGWLLEHEHALLPAAVAGSRFPPCSRSERWFARKIALQKQYCANRSKAFFHTVPKQLRGGLADLRLLSFCGLHPLTDYGQRRHAQTNGADARGKIVASPFVVFLAFIVRLF